MLPNDPFMLLSIINLKLRDFYDSLDSLCDDLDINKSELVEKLSKIGYSYNKLENQFKSND